MGIFDFTEGVKKDFYTFLNDERSLNKKLTNEICDLNKQIGLLRDSINAAVLLLDKYFANDEQEPDLVAEAFTVLRPNSDVATEGFYPQAYDKILRKIAHSFKFELQKYRDEQNTNNYN